MTHPGYALLVSLSPLRPEAGNLILFITMGKAKRGGVFGMIRGSVGPATYSIGKDGAGKKQQIIREKPTEVANPRTRKQAIQRMKMVPITYAMGLLSDIVDHSFRGVQEGLPSKRYFMSLAMKELDIPFIAKGSLDRAIGGYQISAGTLGDARLINRIMDSMSSPYYDQLVPATLAFSMVYNDSQSYGGKTWAECSAKLLQDNPGLQNGDEIAVLSFVIDNNNKKGVRLVKRRMLIDTNFTTETPADFIRTSDDQTWDFNAVYAFSIYNDMSAADLKDYMDAYSVVAPNYTAGYAFSFLMGILPSDGMNPNAGGGAVALNKVYEPGDDLTNAELRNMIPQTAAQATNGKLAAAALIISRREDSAWNYTISDICLTAGYLATVNTNALMEKAIASYMSETAVDTSSSEYYLQRTDSDVESYGFSTIRLTGHVDVSGTSTAVYADYDGRVDPVSGKNIVFVDANGELCYEGIDPTGSGQGTWGIRWRNASTHAYLNPVNYVSVDEVENAENIIWAQQVF